MEHSWEGKNIHDNGGGRIITHGSVIQLIIGDKSAIQVITKERMIEPIKERTKKETSGISAGINGGKTHAQKIAANKTNGDIIQIQPRSILNNIFDHIRFIFIFFFVISKYFLYKK